MHVAEIFGCSGGSQDSHRDYVLTPPPHRPKNIEKKSDI